MGSIRVIVDATKERSRGIFTNVLHEQMATARVFIDECRDVVNKACNKYQWPLLTLFLDYRHRLARTMVGLISRTHNFATRL